MNPRWRIGLVAGFAPVVTCLACKSTLSIGSFQSSSGGAEMPAPTAESPVTVADAQAPVPEPFQLPWQTGFEDGFSDYDQVEGGCEATPSSSYGLVSAPVHSGSTAAAFQAGADATEDGFFAHCVRYGELPRAAFYGAWYYVPTEVTSATVWALMHFDGSGGDVQHNLWDVLLELDANGSLRANAFDYLHMTTLRPETGGEIPVGAWFHVEVYWERAADATGTFELYVDGARVLAANDLVTDDAETSEWYVGNFAALTIPNPNTVYVDDVSISATRVGGN